MFMKYSSIAAALAQLLAISNGHMIMQTPKPFGGPDLDNSPLTAGNFPCKLKGDPATFYSTSGLDNTMAVGESQSLSFKGSAVHGGGSCQLAITKDLQPSASTSWQVILSIEGGCPSKSGQGPDTYDFKIPDGVAPGKYVFAWTWISKLAGQPEYYMNCAPITVTGGKSKRSDNETMELFPRDGQFPELFVGNLADINSCKTEPSTDPQYPDPGPNVIRPGSNNKFAKVQGENCVPKGAKSGGSSGSADPAGQNTPNNGGNGGGNDSGNGNGGSSTAAPSSSAAPVTSAAPGSFITVAPVGGSSSAAAPQSSSAAPVVSSPASSAATTLSTSVVSSAVSSAVPAPVSSASPAGSAPPSTGSPSGGLTGPCTSEGMFNCIGGTAYQQCASGSWSTVMQMAPTVKCAEGQTMTLWGRDETPRKIVRRVNW
ncbi:putative dna-directed rna polymerase protein [Daldinia childiae]|uniref:putative dna-directed rna polymerase protein n=1 Tax=Daldinia childiae TaxID=326645 RepID=UPI001444A801|nr:putative dna-directed rna polymerase protein [Daldinia childiae]KAF3063814.1 putative dna-directed rna polymerase protein [Daldinia childiae]